MHNCVTLIIDFQIFSFENNYKFRPETFSEEDCRSENYCRFEKNFLKFRYLSFLTVCDLNKDLPDGAKGYGVCVYTKVFKFE